MTTLLDEAMCLMQRSKNANVRQQEGSSAEFSVEQRVPRFPKVRDKPGLYL